MFKVIRKNQRLLRGKHSEVKLIVDCHTLDAKVVEQTLWKNLALGVSKVLYILTTFKISASG